MEVANSVVVASSLIAAGVLLLSWSFTTTSGATRRKVLDNLQRNLDGPREGDLPGQRTASAPVLVRMARAATPSHWLGVLDRLLAGAGRPGAWPIERILVTKLVLGALMAALGLLLVEIRPNASTVVLGLVLVAMGWFAPEVMLYNISIKRRKSILVALPDVLDQLSIAVEAGLGFEAAMAHVGRNSPGPLGEELIRTLQDIQVGVPRRVAYRSLGERARVDDLARFLRAIAQAEQYGVSVADVLNAQAREMRIKRRQRAEESALKIPVKVVFPLTLFILPTLFIVVLGPAAVSAFQTWRG